MKSKIISRGILRALAIVVGILVLAFFLYKISSILLYIGIAAVIALIGRPLVYFLRKKLHIPNQLAVIITLLLIFSIIIGIFSIFIPVINQQSENFAKLDLNEVKNNLNTLNSQFRDYLGLEQVDFVDSLHLKSYLDNFSFKSVSSYLGSIFGTMGTVIIGIFAVVFISFFFLKDSSLLLNSIVAFSKDGNEEKFERVFNKIKNLLSRYFIGITLQIFVLFIFYAILLSVFNIQNAIAVAFICAFINIVPYLGPLAAGILMVFFVVSNNLGEDFSTVILPNTLYVLAGYLITQLIDNIINQPLIFGHSVKSHPLEIFLVIIIAGILFGVFGMIIAVPTYTAMKVIAKETLSKYKIVKYLTKGL